MLEDRSQGYGEERMKILYIPATAALVALFPMEHDGYMLVRLIVCAFLLYAGVKTKSQGSPDAGSIGAEEASLIFFVIAAVYNPIFPLHLGRGLWMLIDVGVAAYLFWFVRLSYKVVTPENFEIGDKNPGTQLLDGKKVDEKADKLMSTLLWSSLASLLLFFLFSFLAKN